MIPLTAFFIHLNAFFIHLNAYMSFKWGGGLGNLANADVLFREGVLKC